MIAVGIDGDFEAMWRSLGWLGCCGLGAGDPGKGREYYVGVVNFHGGRLGFFLVLDSPSGNGV